MTDVINPGLLVFTLQPGVRPKQGLVHGPVVLVALASLTKITRPYMGIAAASVAQDNWIAVSPCPLCAHIVYGDC